MADDVKYSDLVNDPQQSAVISNLDTDDVFALARENQSSPTGFDSMVGRASVIARGMLGSFEYPTDLPDFNDQSVFGALEELKQTPIPETDITTDITTPAPIMTFNDGGDNIPMKSLIAEIKAVQAGTGTPSPQNVRSISGWNNVNVDKHGINLLNPNTLTIGYRLLVSNGQPDSVASNERAITDYINVKGGQSYYLRVGNLGSTTYGQCWYDKNKNYISGIYSNATNENKAFVAPDNAYFLRCTVDTTKQNAVNYPSTNTEYVAYQGVTETIALGQTIYGGYLDVLSGKVTITHEKVNLSDLTWNRSSQGYRFYATLPSGYPWQSGLTMYCSCFAFDGVGNSDLGYYGAENTIRYYFNPDKNPSYELYIRTTVDTVEDLQPLLSGQTFVYPKLTPTNLSVRGTNISTLSGLNNIYADSGDIKEVEYFNNKANDIARMVELISGKQVDLIGTLTTGQTSLTIQSEVIKTTSTIDVYTDVFDVYPSNIVVTDGQIVLTFASQASDVGVKVRVS